MYSFPDLETVCCSMSTSNCCFQTCIQISQGRSGGLVFPSLEEFSTVCCGPHSHRLWHSQYSRSRCFSGTLLLFLWSNRCWQFDLWFIQLEHVEILDSRTVEASLGEFWALLRESIPRQVDKKSRVPKEEKGVWGSQGGDRIWNSQGGKDKLSFYIPY